MIISTLNQALEHREEASRIEMETQKFIKDLMFDIRELVLGLQETNLHLKERTDLPHSDEHSISTATISTGNTARPPPYKSVIQPPEVPIRTRKIKKMPSEAIARGAFIVLEGLDRVGKSTLAKRLVEHLERIRKPVTHCRFPDRETPIGKVINEILTDKDGSKRIDDHSMHLLFSANRWEHDRQIRNALLKGTTVVADRYSYSGIAYSSAKRGLSIDWCKEPEKGLPKPDLVIFLELPREAQYNRPGFGDEKFETREMQELVRGQYEQLMEVSEDTWLRIDVENKGPDEVLGEVIVPVKRCLEACANKSIGDLDFYTKN